jgi:hypothetical protein
MKKAIMVVLALSLMLSVVPVMAETSSQAPALQAMSNLSTVVPMTDQQLAAVEGAFVIQSNRARVVQVIRTFAGCNSAFGSFSCNQSATIIQLNVNDVNVNSFN